MSKLRDDASARLRDALGRVEACGVYDAPAVSRWVSAAPPRQNRRRMLKAVLACRAARVTNGAAMRDNNINPTTHGAWAAKIYAAERRNHALSEALFTAVETIRKGMITPVELPERMAR